MADQKTFGVEVHLIVRDASDEQDAIDIIKQHLNMDSRVAEIVDVTAEELADDA